VDIRSRMTRFNVSQSRKKLPVKQKLSVLMCCESEVTAGDVGDARDKYVM